MIRKYYKFIKNSKFIRGLLAVSFAFYTIISSLIIFENSFNIETIKFVFKYFVFNTLGLTIVSLLAFILTKKNK